MKTHRILAQLVFGSCLATVAHAAAASASPTVVARPADPVRQWQTDQQEFNSLATKFANFNTAQLVAKVSAAVKSASMPPPTISTSRTPANPGSIFIVNSATVHFANTPLSALTSFVAAIQRDAPNLMIDEMVMAPGQSDATQRQGEIRIFALEIKPGATDPGPSSDGTAQGDADRAVAIAAKEALLAKFRTFAGQNLRPFEMLGAINPFLPADITFTKTRFYDGSKVQIDCLATSSMAVTQYIDALSTSTIVDLDKSHLSIQANPLVSPPQYEFVLHLTFKSGTGITKALPGASSAPTPKAVSAVVPLPTERPSLLLVFALAGPAIMLLVGGVVWLVRRK